MTSQKALDFQEFKEIIIALQSKGLILSYKGKLVREDNMADDELLMVFNDLSEKDLDRFKQIAEELTITTVTSPYKSNSINVLLDRIIKYDILEDAFKYNSGLNKKVNKIQTQRFNRAQSERAYKSKFGRR